MRLKENPQIHLTYCLNVHSGESWQENFDAITQNTLVIRDKIATGKAFGLGLRLSFEAASQLIKTEKLDEFSRFLQEEDLYVFSVNGFPYGQFHNTSVKEDVYRPDWQSPQRRNYTMMLADILARLLPEGVQGSISTLPLSYKKWITSGSQTQQMVHRLADVAVHLNAIEKRDGKNICLGLEPEPDCLIENTDELLEFFSGLLLNTGTDYIERNHGLRNSEEILRRHIGICFDTAHLAVEFEDLAESYRKIKAASIPICKVQLSVALELKKTTQALDQLNDFSDTVYLHQVKVQTKKGVILSYADMPKAIKEAASGRWRIHFHVPLFFTENGNLESTASCLDPDFFGELLKGYTPHLEIETYTFDVLPDFLRHKGVVESITKEYQWVFSQLEAKR
ncbi:MAG: metabolite traffic protein EboE [Planctomycetota bacterium]|jgi:sugar phosphate isomerase/epimerase